ncbi:sulfite reductase subunit alpha [Roseomonas sp. 18066]|uniref:sulfite reductase subunit alpha n=1 Tax=Roseomonas sp. 18066 TaxID=2681412 RepID=UPI001359510F|nr:sulfite reductase subunit alpha [Roseomonas sp. 18066]
MGGDVTIFSGLFRRRRAAPAPDRRPLLLAHASQTGLALRLAEQSASALRAGGVEVSLRPLAQLDAAALARAGRALLIVSTHGEGAPPDAARGFARQVMRAPAALAGLETAILALGDSAYPDFCAFGRQLAAWLARSGARPLTPPIEADRASETALAAWQALLERLGAAGGVQLSPAPMLLPWRLVQRDWINRGSPGAALYRLRLTPPAAQAWQAGDLLEVQPRGGHGALRRYSIASIGAEGHAELLVRQLRGPDGRPGLGSFWLTEGLPLRAAIAGRVIANPGFHAPPDGCPLILLGNGSGMAGLRAHLSQRIARGQHRNWLLFGERSRAHDFHGGAEIERWRRTGCLARLDLAFSREAPCQRYVQHALAERERECRAWLRDGACLYVCGGRAGMAPAVHGQLEAWLGAPALEAMAAAGRYRRDIY